MKFGKLFTKLINRFPQFVNLSANKCSLLTYKELREIAKILYKHYPNDLQKYFMKPHEELAKMVYTALKNL
jgi:hypothetical protein